MVTISEQEVWKILSEIPDPDIPVVSITELGLVRKVEIADNTVIVTLTPSYSGCTAMQYFKTEIIANLEHEGFDEVKIKTVYSPAWTTDWISEEVKEKMRKHGIAPPVSNAKFTHKLFSDSETKVSCPWCNHSDTKKTSQFGSTPCKAIWFCNSCKQPFEYFKCI